jgi:hypothetical protein
VLEVKDYPNAYVPLAEFTAITANFETNLDELFVLLRQNVLTLGAEGRQDAALALTEALDGRDVQVELWLGESTVMGENEKAARSVMAKLRASIDAQPGNIHMITGPASRVTAASEQQSIAARAAKKTP